MDQSPEVNPLLAAAPRHLRRRPLHQEIPDTLLVPDAQPVLAPTPRTGGRAPLPPVRPRSSGAAARPYRRKRFMALGLMALIAAGVLCLAVALVFHG